MEFIAKVMAKGAQRGRRVKPSRLKVLLEFLIELLITFLTAPVHQLAHIAWRWSWSGSLTTLPLLTPMGRATSVLLKPTLPWRVAPLQRRDQQRVAGVWVSRVTSTAGKLRHSSWKVA